MTPEMAFMKRHMDLIATHGWSSVGVMPTVADPGVPFLYTCGFTELGHPELVVYGLPPQQAHYICETAYERIKEGLPFAEGQVRDDVLQGGFKVAVVRPKTDEANTARALYPEATVLQLVWPDAKHRFPWDEGYSVQPGQQGEVAW